MTQAQTEMNIEENAEVTAESVLQLLAKDTKAIENKLKDIRKRSGNWLTMVAQLPADDICPVLHKMVLAVEGLHGLSVERFVKYVNDNSNLKVSYNKKRNKWTVKPEVKDATAEVSFNNPEWWLVSLASESSSSDPKALEEALAAFITTRLNAGDEYADLEKFITQAGIDLASAG